MDVSKHKKLLFVASLPTKKMNFDGERNKSRDVLNAIKKTGRFKIDIVNLSKNKCMQIFKMLFLYLFKKYDSVFVSKCIVGGSFAIHLLNKIKYNDNTIFYIIGNGYYGFDDKNIYFDDINKCKRLIVESDIVKKSMIQKGAKADNIDIFPCLKPKYDLEYVEHEYTKNQTLKLIYFSRINPDKGLGDLIETIIKINSRFEKPIFILDISGGVSNEPGIKEFNEYVVGECNKYNYLNYIGMTLRITGIESYKTLQKYDLHVFPSHFKQECAPGAILDMFVAGVPTLSSKFPSYITLLNEENSYLFEQCNNADLEKKLLYIYENGYKELNKKRALSFAERLKYTDEEFINKCINNL